MDNHITKILCNAPAPKRRRTKKKGEVFSSKCNELPAEVVYEIMKHLALPDFLSAGRACEGWRAAAKDMGHTILESFPPLAMSMKSGARKFMSYHNIVNGDRYRSKVLAYVRKEFKGISGGFIAFENCHGIWFGNPVTSKELEFYKPLGFTHLSDRSILVKRIPSEDYLVLVLYRRCKTIHAIRHGTTDWLMFSYCHAPWDIVDLVVCNERVFGLTSDGRLGIIGLTASSITFRMILMERRQFMMNAKLVSYDGEQIMVAEYLGPRQVRITRADMNPDMNLAQWEVLKNLENLSLFVDDYNTYRLCDPSGWGGRTNSVYFLHSRTSVYSVFPYPTSDDDDDDFHDYELCTQHGSPLDNVRGWYFPTLIYSLDRVRDHIIPQPQLRPWLQPQRQLQPRLWPRHLQPGEGSSAQPWSHDGSSQLLMQLQMLLMRRPQQQPQLQLQFQPPQPQPQPQLQLQPQPQPQPPQPQPPHPQP